MSDDPLFDINERLTQHQQSELSPQRAETRRLAKATRDVIERLVATRAPIEDLARAADALEQVAEMLSDYPQGRLYEGFAEVANAGDPHAHFEHSPLLGRSNPLAPPIQLEIVDGRVHGHARFGSAYEGPPNCVHGGYVAAAFDEVLGFTQSLGGRPGMTGTLTIRYRKPTPLHTDLRFEGDLVRVDGRKTFTEGRVYAGDLLTAEAEGIFISVDFGRFVALAAERDRERKD